MMIPSTLMHKITDRLYRQRLKRAGKMLLVIFARKVSLDLTTMQSSSAQSPPVAADSMDALLMHDPENRFAVTLALHIK
jgi:hypothetical protein